MQLTRVVLKEEKKQEPEEAKHNVQVQGCVADDRGH